MARAIGRIVLLLAMGTPQLHPDQAQPPVISRSEMILLASQLANVSWTATKESQKADCLASPTYSGPTYTSDYKAGETVLGLPYDWGGMDSPETFMNKLKAGKSGAGSHKRHECEKCGHCTMGTDCSGLVSFCWRLGRHYGTAEISTVAIGLSTGRFNVFSDLKPGDALNSPGNHIVLFVKYDSNGYPVVYESSGAAKRVVLQSHPWAYFNKPTEMFEPVRYSRVAD
jgi:hypothetical protein